MNIKYMVTHCYREDYDLERWDVLNIFDNVEEAIKHVEDCRGEYSVNGGFLFIDVGWNKE